MDDRWWPRGMQSSGKLQQRGLRWSMHDLATEDNTTIRSDGGPAGGQQQRRPYTGGVAEDAGPSRARAAANGPRLHSQVDGTEAGFQQRRALPKAEGLWIDELAGSTAAQRSAPSQHDALPAKRRRHKGNWTDEQLAAAMAAIEAGTKVAIVSREFRISDSSLRDHLYGRTIQRKKGPHSVLTDNEESQLVKWML